MKKSLFTGGLQMAIAISGFCLLFISCDKEIEKTYTPQITTSDVTELTPAKAISGGEVIDEGAFPVFARGVVWGVTKNPSIEEHEGISSDGSGIGPFESQINGLTPNTKYFIRAYAINTSGTGYGQNISLTTPDGVIDADGNVYNVVLIGGQKWMRESLRTTKYNDQSVIPLITAGATWAGLTTSAYCWYNNDPGYADPYGAIYNFYAVNTGKLCPAGWHVPTIAEYQVLFDYLGGSETAGTKLKEAGTSHWQAPNTGAVNTSGFTALPAGAREVDGSFIAWGTNAAFWASDLSGSSYAYYWWLSPNSGLISSSVYFIKAGLSVRCLKNQ